MTKLKKKNTLANLNIYPKSVIDAMNESLKCRQSENVFREMLNKNKQTDLRKEEGKVILPVLTDEELEKLLGEDFRTAYSGHVAEYRSIAKAQRDADIEALFKMARDSPTGTFIIDSKIQSC